MKIRLLVISLVLSVMSVLVGSTFVEQIVSATTDNRNSAQSMLVQTSPCANGKESGLPLPSGFLPAKLSDFQAQLKSFLSSGKYKTLKWCEDKKLRDTGPFVNTVPYGVHPTVKIYYSPSVINWLIRRDTGQVIPDGAMIVKEQYTAPAARYQVQQPTINGWTIMIKDSKGSQDG